MAPNNNQIDRSDNRAVWTILAVVVVAVVAYTAYATYVDRRGPNNNMVTSSNTDTNR